MKYIFTLLAALVGIYLLLCILGPKNMNVERSTQITAPANIPFNLANNLNSTELWNAWVLNDSTMSTTYGDVAEGMGATSAFKSESSGAGTTEIIESNSNSLVKTKMTFEGWDGESFTYMTFTGNGNSTDVSWRFEGTALPFFMRGFGLITGMKKMMSTNYEAGLANLKKISEERSNGVYYGQEVKETILDKRHFIMNRQMVDPVNIQQFYATNLGSLFAKAQTAGIEMQGMPCGLYFSIDMEDSTKPLDMAAAIPISTAVSVEGAGFYSIEPQSAVTLDYYGDYHTIPTGHIAMEAYMKDRGYLLDYPVIEEYVTDPGEEPDPSKYLTRITRYYTPASQ